MKSLLLVIITIPLSIPACFAQTIDKTKLDTYLETLETNNKFMGSIAVAVDGKLIYNKSNGFADVENKLNADKNTIYRIGSITKTFTAVLIMKAIEENKIQLDQTLNKYYPSIENANKITIEQLLYHRTGIHSFTNDEDYLTWNTTEKTEKELIEIIAKGKSEFEPDSKFEYSNANYILLSFILQKIYKKNYAEILKEKITTPLDLNNTFSGENNKAKDKNCSSYSFNGKWEKENVTHLSIPMGAGAISSTPVDLVKFADALFTEKIIKKKSIDQMTTFKDDFGIGLFSFPFYDTIGFGHTGAIDGFTSMLIYFPETKISFAMTSNGTNYSNNEIAKTVLSAAFNKPYEIPQFTTYQATEKELDQYLGVYATEDLPLKLTITRNGTQLMAQATGQDALSLDATEKNVFTFDRVGIVIVFDTEKKSLLLKQGGGEYNFVRE